MEARFSKTRRRDASKVSVQVKVADGAQLALVDLEIKLKCLVARVSTPCMPRYSLGLKPRLLRRRSRLCRDP